MLKYIKIVDKEQKMISIDLKAESSTSSSSKTSKADAKAPLLSFSELLKGISTKPETKVIQNGSLILALDAKQAKENSTLPLNVKVASSQKATSKEPLLALKEDSSGSVKTQVTKQESLASLLKSSDQLEINPVVTNSLSITELKQLIAEAKQYLKSKISELQEYKDLKTKELPKTLKGLATLAKKLNIDISKITIEDVHVVKKEAPKLVLASNEEKKVQEEKTPKEVKSVKQSEKQTQVEDTPHVKTTKSKNVKEAKNELVQEQIEEVKTQVDRKEVKELKESKIASIKTSPLFKAQNTQELSTEQIVQAKQIKVEQKTPKEKADETLKLLLSGDKAAKSDTKLTADFSVATARVIAPSATKESTKTLESLLRGEQPQGEEITKLESSSTHKAESFEVKIKEAKQMINYLSKDVKTAIEEYKAPFTRVKVQLNPQKLGSVELTVVQRGKNLHVNLSSNNAAINTLAMNANDLKTQLNNNGINNATLNFSNSSGDGSASGQQNRQQSQNAHQEYKHFQNEEQNEEILSSLEIVVPHYA